MDYIEAELDWRLLRTVSRQLARHPPLHVLVQAFMGIEPGDLPAAAADPPDEETRRASFIQAFQAAGGSIN